MAQSQALRYLAPFARQIDSTITLDTNVPIASHALQGRGHRWRRHPELFGQARTDRGVVLLKHLPDGFEIVFLRNAGLVPTQSFPRERTAPRARPLAR